MWKFLAARWGVVICFFDDFGFLADLMLRLGDVYCCCTHKSFFCIGADQSKLRTLSTRQDFHRTDQLQSALAMRHFYKLRHQPMIPVAKYTLRMRIEPESTGKCVDREVFQVLERARAQLFLGKVCQGVRLPVNEVQRRDKDERNHREIPRNNQCAEHDCHSGEETL
jgi:hypothetical protein